MHTMTYYLFTTYFIIKPIFMSKYNQYAVNMHHMGIDSRLSASVMVRACRRTMKKSMAPRNREREILLSVND